MSHLAIGHENTNYQSRLGKIITAAIIYRMLVRLHIAHNIKYEKVQVTLCASVIKKLKKAVEGRVPYNKQPVHVAYNIS